MQDGKLALEEFASALFAMKVYLPRPDVDRLFKRHVPVCFSVFLLCMSIVLISLWLQIGYLLDIEQFLAHTRQESAKTGWPDVLKPASYRNAGDIFTWKSEAKREEKEKVLYRGKLGMLNDGYSHWERKAPAHIVVPPSRLDTIVRVTLTIFLRCFYA